MSHTPYRVERVRLKQCSKSTIASILSHMDLRQFYLLLYILLQSSLYLQPCTQVYWTSATLQRLFVILTKSPPPFIHLLQDVASTNLTSTPNSGRHLYDVVLTPYNCPESAFNFETWQEPRQCRLPLLLLPSPPQATTAPSTNSSPEAVIHSVPLEGQPQPHKGKGDMRNLGPTAINRTFQVL